jgi:hypothetical protein
MNNMKLGDSTGRDEKFSEICDQMWHGKINLLVTGSLMRHQERVHWSESSPGVIRERSSYQRHLVIDKSTFRFIFSELFNFMVTGYNNPGISLFL